MPTTPEDLKKINAAIKQASDSLTRVEAEKDFLKDVREAMKADYNLPPKMFNKLLKAYHKQNFPEETAQAEEFQEMYEKVFPQKSNG